MVNKKMYSEAVRMALKVRFLESREEFDMYVRAVCSAMKWGADVSKKVQKSD